MYTVQCKEAKQWICEAEHDKEKENKDKTITLTIDMTQNGTVLLLSRDQCGNFYYMSPLTQFIFGVVDNNHFCNVYIWAEGTASRGTDNIVSCLYWDLSWR